MMKDKNNLTKIIGIPLFLLLIVGIIIYTQYWEKKFETEDVIYFVGTIQDYTIGAKTSPSFDYDYFAFGEKYSGNKFVSVKRLPKPLKSYIGKRYYVKVLPDHPKVSRLMLDKPVPSHIKKAPTKGWEKIPR